MSLGVLMNIIYLIAEFCPFIFLSPKKEIIVFQVTRNFKIGTVAGFPQALEIMENLENH